MPQPDRTSPDADGLLRQRRILVGLTGGIACYKTATLVSKLVQQGAIVRVMMSEGATRFITPLTFQSLCGSPVLTSIWQVDDRPDAQHIGLARWCELMIVAPATANIIAKVAHGICDDLISLVACALPQQTPALLAPAMNADMWTNPITQRNMSTIRETLGWHVVGPDVGWQTCRTQGAGRMSEPEAILTVVRQLLAQQPAKSVLPHRTDV